MAKGHIAIICSSPGFGGLELNLLKTAKWLEGNGWKVSMLLNPASEAATIAGRYCKSVSYLKANKRLGFGALYSWMKGQQADILFTAYNKDLKPASLFRRFNGKTALVYQQHMKVGVPKKDIIHRLRYSMIDLWLSPLNYLKQETMARTTVPERRISVVPIPLDPSTLQLGNTPHREAKAALSLPTDKKIIGILGRIDPKKGQDFLIDCMSLIQQKHPGKYHLLIMGNTTAHEGNAYMQSLESQIQRLQLNSHISFRPYSHDVSSFYNAIDVFAMPSHGETYGMVTLEAMYMCIPVVGINTDGTKALLEDGKLGWLSALGDCNAFEQNLLAALSETGTLKAQKAYDKIAKEYLFDAVMPRLDAALKKIIK